MRENSSPNERLTFMKFVLLAKRERRGFDSSSPHQFFGVKLEIANN